MKKGEIVSLKHVWSVDVHLNRQALATLYHSDNLCVSTQELVQLKASLCSVHLSSSARDEEPLIDAGIDWGRCQVLVLWDMRKLVWADTATRMLDSEIGPI
jgi:hypothetical protein